MKNSLFNGVGSAFAIVFIGVSSSALAQGGASGLVYVPGPFECAQACTSDLMCASWNFTPLNKVSGQSMGQCKLSNSQTSAQNPGTISGLPQRAAPQSQIYYSSQGIPSAPAQILNNSSSQIPDWKQPPKANYNASNSSGNYAIKPLNQPVISAPAYPHAPMGAPVMAAPMAPVSPVQGAPVVVYSPKAPAAAPMVQVAKPQPAPMPANAQQFSAMQPQQPMVTPQPAPLKPPVIAQTPVMAQMQTPVESPPASNGPLRAGGYKAPEAITEPSYKTAEVKLNAPQYSPSSSYQNYKSSGSPQYSVQSEWNNVADAVASGKNSTNIDWSKTTPVIQNTEVETEAKPEKKSWFQGIFNKKESEPSEPQSNGGFGPLRKN